VLGYVSESITYFILKILGAFPVVCVFTAAEAKWFLDDRDRFTKAKHSDDPECPSMDK